MALFNKANVRKGASVMFGPGTSKAAEAVLGLAISAALVRIMAIEDFGRFSFVFVLARTMSLPARQGIAQLLIREVARERENERWDTIGATLQWAVTFSLAWALPASVATFALYYFSATYQGDPLVLEIACLCLVMCLSGCAVGFSRAIKRPTISLLPESSLGPSLFLAVTGVLVWTASSFGAGGALLLRALGIAVALAIAMGILARFLRQQRPQMLGGRAKPGLLRALGPFTLVGSMTVLNQQTGLMIAGYVADPEAIALYRIADQFAFLLIFVPTVINIVGQPYIAASAQAGRVTELRRLLITTSVAAGLFSGLLLATVLLAGETVLGVAYGPEFRAAYPILAILAIARAFNCATIFHLTFLNMAGAQKRLVLLLGASLALQFPFGVYFGKRFGVEGIALTTSVAITLTAIGILTMAWIRLRSGMTETRND